MNNENIFIVTDLCMWENNKQNKTYFPHAIQVVDFHTGQVRYIKSGARIQLLEGHITPSHSQEEYNKEKNNPMPCSGEDKLLRKKSKTSSKRKDIKVSKNKGV